MLKIFSLFCFKNVYNKTLTRKSMTEDGFFAKKKATKPDFIWRGPNGVKRSESGVQCLSKDFFVDINSHFKSSANCKS